MFINVYSIYFNPIFICSLTCLSHGAWQTAAVKTIPTANCFSLLLLQPVQRASPQGHRGEKLEHIISTLHIAFFSPDVFIDRACSCCYMIFCFFLSTSTHPIWSHHIFLINWAVSGKRKEAHSTFEYMCDLFYCVLVHILFLPMYYEHFVFLSWYCWYWL